MRNLIWRSLIYLGASFAVQGMGLMLIPLYSHFLTPADYGIWGLTNTVAQILGMLMSFGMMMAVGRFYFDAPDDKVRRETLGTIVIFLAVAPLIVLMLLEWQGTRLFQTVTPDVSYYPYIQIAVWATFLSTFSVVPLMVLRSQEQAKWYAFLSVGQAALYQMVVILMVVALRQGVLGLLLGNLASWLLLLPVYIYFTFRVVTFRFMPERLIEILRYSLPLIPHNIAGWVLMLSDRLILQHWVPLSDVGVYSLGYALGGAVITLVGAVNTAWYPSFFKLTSDADGQGSLTRATTYIVAFICCGTLFISVMSFPFTHWILPAAYAGADQVIFWVSLAGIPIILYNIWSLSIHYSKKTTILPVISWAAGGANILLNIILIPRVGYAVAALNTTLAYLLMAILGGVGAARVGSPRYEYARWAKLILATVGLSFVSTFRPFHGALMDVLYSLGLVSLWPVVLLILGFFVSAEKEKLKSWLITLGSEVRLLSVSKL